MKLDFSKINYKADWEGFRSSKESKELIGVTLEAFETFDKYKKWSDDTIKYFALNSDYKYLSWRPSEIKEDGDTYKVHVGISLSNKSGDIDLVAARKYLKKRNV